MIGSLSSKYDKMELEINGVKEQQVEHTKTEEGLKKDVTNINVKID